MGVWGNIGQQSGVSQEDSSRPAMSK
jgi:hypothetical protein